MIKKILFWLFVIGIGFVNPIFSGILVVLYYLPKIITDFCHPCDEYQNESKMKSYSEDVLDDMK